ncbi:MAG: hypothetical protein J07HQX50_00853 [Haloquadratum sp. J07HQX50]|nr:MAG: hypothetical protein J07HQX50_00853 [Haloquadratum sp. J07HQX50]
MSSSQKMGLLFTIEFTHSHQLSARLLSRQSYIISLCWWSGSARRTISPLSDAGDVIGYINFCVAVALALFHTTAAKIAATVESSMKNSTNA